MRKLALLFTMAAITGASHATAPDTVATPHLNYPGKVLNLTGLVYESLPGYRPLQLELYLPTAVLKPRLKPAVIWLHGGGWMVGDPRAVGILSKAFPDWPTVLARLAARGYVVAGVSYRFSRESHFPAAIGDVKAAVRWLRMNAATYGIDPDHILVWGASAGGQLAALLGTSCNAKALEPATDHPEISSCVQGVIDWFGPTDFSQMDAEAALPHDASKSKAEMPAPDPGLSRPATGPQLHDAAGSAESNLLGCALRECPAGRVQSANPITYISASTPPFLIMHGTADTAVPIEQSQILYEALKAKGVEAQLVRVPGVNHMFNGATDAEARGIIDTVFKFIDAHARPAAPAR